MKVNYSPKTEACFSVYYNCTRCGVRVRCAWPVDLNLIRCGDTSMVVGMAQELPGVDKRQCDACQKKEPKR